MPISSLSKSASDLFEARSLPGAQHMQPEDLDRDNHPGDDRYAQHSNTGDYLPHGYR